MKLDSESASPPVIDYHPFSGSPLTAFKPVSESVVCDIIKNTVMKTCELDPIPTSLLCDCLDSLTVAPHHSCREYPTH